MNTDYLIKKWLADDLTEAEEETFKELNDHDLNMDIIEHAAYFKASHFSVVDDFEKFSVRLETNKSPLHRHWIRPLLKIAAVLVVGLGIYFMFFFNNITEIQTLAAENTRIALPDASVVILNALSGIRYSKNRWSSNREVKLSGEAFFDVAKGAVFDVITSGAKVSVLGTRFNVKQRKDYFEVKCFEGMVKVSSGDSLVKLSAGHTYRISGGAHSQDTTSYEQPQWISDISSFKSVVFGEVIAELERQYNIKVILEAVNTDRLFTGSFMHNNLEEALKSISEPLDLSYKKEGSDQIRLYAGKR